MENKSFNEARNIKIYDIHCIRFDITNTVVFVLSKEDTCFLTLMPCSSENHRWKLYYIFLLQKSRYPYKLFANFYKYFNLSRKIKQNICQNKIALVEALLSRHETKLMLNNYTRYFDQCKDSRKHAWKKPIHLTHQFTNRLSKTF